ncbi:MAG: PhzF family phenazine biosynthesis protein [Gammaproteobacteria bacterium]
MKTYIVDAFTDQPFRGNPAGVCLVEDALSDDRMLSIAQELNLSETAFLRRHSADEPYSIRFFSPLQEIPLCGHATLASAKVLFEQQTLTAAAFINVNGLKLTARKDGDNVVLKFPVYATRPSEAPAPMLQALGIASTRNVEYNEETRILLLEIESTKDLAGLEPDFTALRRSHDSINGVLVTARSSADEFDFHSRYFWPWSGGNEDPVTGGTHTFLARYWGDRLGKRHLRSFQASKRTGFLDLELDGEFVHIGGQAQIVLTGEMHVA